MHKRSSFAFWWVVIATLVYTNAVSAQYMNPDPVPSPQSLTDYAWQSSAAEFRPPDFESYFPDNPPGARTLEAWWASDDPADVSPDRAIALIRDGLRHYEADPTPLLEWFGKTFIYRKSNQHPAAIELMYHAATCRSPNEDNYGARNAALHYGLSVVRPMSDAVLRALVEICILVDDPADLSRIAWGITPQRSEALAFLSPHLESDDPLIREKAHAVHRILNRELQASTWALERRKNAIEAAYGEVLNTFTDTLRIGTSAQRLTMLAFIESEDITLIMNDDHLADFVTCAEDRDPSVRQHIARQVGKRWIGNRELAHPHAVALMKWLSEDADPTVRYNALYYGLSTITPKNADMVRLLVALALSDPRPEIRQRVAWGLRGQKADLRALLESYIRDGSSAQAVAAQELYQDLQKRRPSTKGQTM